MNHKLKIVFRNGEELYVTCKEYNIKKSFEKLENIELKDVIGHTLPLFIDFNEIQCITEEFDK